jgi:RNA-directed DNA polymerase
VFSSGPSWIIIPPANRRGPTRSEIYEEQCKPIALPAMAGEPQGALLALWVKDCEKSECCAVIVQILIGSFNIIRRESEQTFTGSLMAREFEKSLQMGKQMTVTIDLVQSETINTGASVDVVKDWSQIHWRPIEEQVKRLQMRIAKAV